MRAGAGSLGFLVFDVVFTNVVVKVLQPWTVELSDLFELLLQLQ